MVVRHQMRKCRVILLVEVVLYSDWLKIELLVGNQVVLLLVILLNVCARIFGRENKSYKLII